MQWEDPVCVLCQGRIRTVWLTSEVAGQRVTMVRCPACDLHYLTPRPLPEDIGAFYPHDYGPHKAEGHNPGRKSRRFRMLDGLPPGRILDIGCGSGYDLARLRSGGWTLYGVEPDPKAADEARRMGIEIFHGSAERASFPDRFFRAVTMFHAIEHVHDPVATLANVRRMLAEDGVVIVTTPNIMSVNFSLFRTHWHGLEIPRHLYWFNIDSLRKVARRSGLEVRMWRCRSGMRGFRYSLMNRCPWTRPLFRFKPSRLYAEILFEVVVDAMRLGDVIEVVLTRAGERAPLTPR